jgi:hypothetical protein
MDKIKLNQLTDAIIRFERDSNDVFPLIQIIQVFSFSQCNNDIDESMVIKFFCSSITESLMHKDPKDMLFDNQMILSFFKQCILAHHNLNKYKKSLEILLFLREIIDSRFQTCNWYDLERSNVHKLELILEGKFDANRDFFSTKYDIERCSKQIGFQFLKNPSNNQTSVTIFITTCKRLELFKETINSFLENCLDLSLVNQWVVIDDNSSKEDVLEMQKLYPFLDIKSKSTEEKGHSKSLNKISQVSQNEFIFILEDDWKLMGKKNLISDSIKILESDQRIGQVLSNWNYAESFRDWSETGGGIWKKLPTGENYLLHQWYEAHSEDWKNFVTAIGKPSHVHWPHFSLNPCLLRKSVLNKVGSFQEVQGFEAEFGFSYMKAGFVTAFLPQINFFNIGKRRNETQLQQSNAYSKNETSF